MNTNLNIYKQYAKELINLATPLVMGHLGIILIGAGDVLIAARYSTETLAAASIANSIISCIFMIGVGFFVSISPIISNIRGARKPAKKYFMPSVKFSQWEALIVALLTLLSGLLIPFLGIEKNLVPMIQSYIYLVSLSIFGAYLHGALKEFLQGFEIVFFPNFVAIIGIFLNLILNYIFVFGFWKIPSMGIIGLAIATILVRSFMGLSVLIYCLIRFNYRKVAVSNKFYKDIIRIGLPISFAMLVEFIAFNAVTIFLGRISGLYAAAQSIIIVIVSIIFMFPLAISNAIAIKVGYTNGAKDYPALKNYAKVGIAIPIAFMAFCSIILVCFPTFLAKIFTADKALINIVAPILCFVSVFQIFDALQVSIGGIFKGLKRTNIVLIANFIGYIIVSFPLGLILGLYLKMNIFGFWLGLLAGSMTINIILFIALFLYRKKLV